MAKPGGEPLVAHPASVANEAKLMITVTAALRIRGAGPMSLPPAFCDGRDRGELEALVRTEPETGDEFLGRAESMAVQGAPITGLDC